MLYTIGVGRAFLPQTSKRVLIAYKSLFSIHSITCPKENGGGLKSSSMERFHSRQNYRTGSRGFTTTILDGSRIAHHQRSEIEYANHQYVTKTELK